MGAFPEAEKALKTINEKIEPEYKLDKNSLVCLFEIGNRKIEDDRLEFENIIESFSQVQKSYQMKFDRDDLTFANKVKQCRDQNKLTSSNNYERDYIIDYGYKKEKPELIYQLQPLY